MQTLSVENDKRKKKSLLLEELEQYGIIFKANEALEVSEDGLKTLLQELKSKQDVLTRSENQLMGLYEPMMSDYIDKLTVASVFFFSCVPWAALFWPPYYSYRYNKRQEREKSKELNTVNNMLHGVIC